MITLDPCAVVDTTVLTCLLMNALKCGSCGPDTWTVVDQRMELELVNRCFSNKER